MVSMGQHCLAAGLDNCIFLGEEGKNSLYEEGDVVIGGLFPLHYSPVSSLPKYKTKPTPITYNFSSRALRWMLTMTFAIKEINHRSDLLPHLKLGFHIRDSCDDIPVSLSAALLLVNGQPDVGTRAESLNRDKGLESNSHYNVNCAAAQTVSPVIIGDAASGVSMALLKALGSFHIPLVSYFASCSCLSNQKEFPTFMRTMPSDAFQIRALARLVSYFGWTWVGVIGVDSDYARFAIQLFLKESVKYGVCASYTHFYPVGLSQQALDELLDVIQMSSSKVIINFSNESEMQGIMREVRYRNITSLQWIASESWATAKSLWEKFGDLLTGTLGLAIRRADVIPGLKQHLTSVRSSNESAFLAEFWEELFNCRLNGSVNNHSHGGVDHLNRLLCKGTEDLKNVYSPYSDVTQLRVSYNVYKSVYLVAHALEDMSNCKIGQGPFLNRTCADLKNVKPWQLIHYMKRAHFSALGEKVHFDENGDPIAYYDLMNWQRRPDGSLHLVKVGFYDASTPDGRSLVINESVIQWPVGKQAFQSVCSVSCPPGSRIARRKGEPICCFDCVPCAEGEVSNNTDSLECSRCSEDTWPNKARDICFPKTIEYLSYHELMGIVLCVVSVFGACVSLSILAIFFKYKETPLVRANNMELSFLLLVFLALCFLVGLLFIGEPSDWLCRIRYPAFGISFALCISCLLAKTVVVLMAFRSTLPISNAMKWFGPTQQRASVLLGTVVQVIICLIWLLTSPPHANNNTDHSAVIIIECVTGSEIGFWCVLGYISILACMCLLMAFFARKLPDNFNEAKFITFSMLIFFAVWITFIPVYVSTAGKYTVAVHIFAILASAFGVLFCIFAPKCYIIVLEPEKNSKTNMMQR
ncbi:extracellular calcium-sensing receptor-like [Pseudochaenichthys georgianus]|uniref:extracellular calcium-sensing receptor-like n=1 Tax=Pseudochaenichthys georgianus TaxID=52239 RepID=UPI0039C3A1B8